MAQLKQRISTEDARQGSPKRMNFRVLAGSLGLAFIVGLLLYATYRSPEPNPVTQEQPK